MAESEEFRQALFEMHQTHQAALRERLELSDEWYLHDIPWMPISFFDELLELAGEGNYRIVSASERGDWEGGPYRRGSLFFNESARENFRNRDKVEVK